MRSASVHLTEFPSPTPLRVGATRHCCSFTAGACDRTYWSAQLPTFAQSYRVVAIDLPGYGESGRNRSEWSMQAFGRDIATVIDSLRLNKVILVAHSAGGFAVLEAARLRPRQVIGIVGAESYRGIRPGYFERTFTDEQIEQSCCASLRANFADSVTALVRQSFFLPTSRQSLIDSVAQSMSSASPATAIPASRAFSVYRARYLKEALAEVGTSIPIIAINADRSFVDTTVVQAISPNFHLMKIGQLGHFIMIEDPARFNDELKRAIGMISKK